MSVKAAFVILLVYASMSLKGGSRVRPNIPVPKPQLGKTPVVQPKIAGLHVSEYVGLHSDHNYNYLSAHFPLKRNNILQRVSLANQSEHPEHCVLHMCKLAPHTLSNNVVISNHCLKGCFLVLGN